MAFIKEKIADNKQLYDSFHLTYQGKKREVYEFSKWYVDRERDIYFEFLGGGTSDKPSTYAIIWEGRKVIIDVEVRVSKSEVKWFIEEIKASNKLQYNENKIIEIIKEIVREMYIGKSTKVEKIPTVNFVGEEQLNA